MAARFYRQNIAQYNPLSFEEMLFAPSMMRQRHDQLDASLSEVDSSLGQYNALSQDQDFVQKAIDPVSTGLNTMAERLAKEGFNSQSVSEFRKLKSQKDKLWSPTGDVGIAQSRLASFQQKSKELKEQYKNDPKIADFYINELAQSEGLSRDTSGKVINQGLNAINNVRHYDAKEINDLINSQIGNIKADTLQSLGFKDVGNISNVQDIYRQGQIDGITPEKITKALIAQMSPEVIQSARQYGQIHYGDPNVGVQQLQRQIEGAAAGAAYSKLTDSYSVVTNEEAKMDRQAKIDEGGNRIPFIGVGGRIVSEAINPFQGLKFSDDKIVNPGSTQTAQQWKDKGFNVVQGKNGEFTVFSKSGSNEVPIYDSSKQGSSQYTEKAAKFKAFKEKSPELKGLSNEAAYKVIQDNVEKYSQRYGEVEKIALNSPNYTKAVLASAMNSGAYTTEGERVNLDELLKEQGYTSYDDYITKNTNAHAGYRKFGPNGTPVHEFIIGDGKSFFVEAEQNIQAMSQRSTQLNKLVLQGNMSSEGGFTDGLLQLGDENIPVKEVAINPMGSKGKEPYLLQVVPKDSRVNLNDVMLKRLEGQSPERVAEILENNFGLKRNQDFIIKDASTIHREENDLINNVLGNKKTGYMSN